MITRTQIHQKIKIKSPEPPESPHKDREYTKQAGRRLRPNGHTVCPVTTGDALGEGAPKSFQQLAL